MSGLSLRLPSCRCLPKNSSAGSFRQNILHTLLKKELGRFNGRLNSKLEALVRLPGEKHACPCILTEVSRSVFGALFPASQILEEFHQELKSMKNVEKKFIA